LTDTHPAIIVFVKQADKLTGTKLQLIIHARLEVELNTVDIVRLSRWVAFTGAASDRDGRRGTKVSGLGSCRFAALPRRLGGVFGAASSSNTGGSDSRGSNRSGIGGVDAL
jgi:hypothetical protein